MFSKRMALMIVVGLMNGGMECHAAGFDIGVKGKWWRSGQVGYDNSYPDLLSRSFRETVFNPLVDQMITSIQDNMEIADSAKEMSIWILVVLIAFSLFGLLFNYYHFQQTKIMRMGIKGQQMLDKIPRLVNER